MPAQHDYILDNAPGATFRGDLNAALLAVVGQNWGAVAPMVPYGYMFWADTGTSIGEAGILRQRNAANSNWIPICKLSNWALVSVQFQASTAATTANIGTAYAALQSPSIIGATVLDATINASNGGAASTLAVNGGAAYAIKQYDTDGAKIDAILVAGQRATFMLDATPQWILMNPLPPSTSIVVQNVQSGAYTLVASDAGKHILHPSADITARVWTIPANASVAYKNGTVITFVNQNAAGVITIAITTDIMRLAGAGTVGSRTLAANGIATVLLSNGEWLISGTGLT